VNIKKIKYFLYSLVIAFCLMQETPFRTRSLKATSTIINIYKQGTRTNTDKNIDDLFVKFLLY